MKLLMSLMVLFFIFSVSAQDDVEDIDALSLEAPEDIDGDKSINIDEETAEITLGDETPTPAQSKKTNAQPAIVDSAPSSIPATKDQVSFKDVTGHQNYKITCILNDDVREISSVTQPDGTVGIVYKKFGETKTIAVSKTGPDYADQVAEKIHNNLANGKYPYACTKE